MIDLHTQRYALIALVAAALFGASTPLAKLLQADIAPGLLAGLLYLGSGLGLALVKLVLKAGRHAPEPRLTRADFPWLAGAVLSGGVAAPVLLMWGLSGSSASGASLLLNLEAILTTLVAALVFREAVGARIWFSALLMLAASLLLGYDPGAQFGVSIHALAVAAACALWALDNNLTRRISAADPVTIAMIKGLAAGAVNTAIALGAGGTLPGATVLGGALLLGWLAFGISLVLYIVALRHLGSARAASHFGTAPFIGAALSIALVGEPVTMGFAAAFGLMIAATWLVLTEKHAHRHLHDTQRHEHVHTHDEHHHHEHRGDEGPEPHAHPHAHEPIAHSHPHLPDLHHRHTH